MDKIIFTSILIVFPLGQLIKFGMFNLFDVLVGLLAIYTIFKKPQPKAGPPLVEKYPKWFSYFLSFILFGLFSWIFNYFVFNNILAFKGLLYLFRLFIYSYVAIYVFNFYRKKIIIYYLLILSCASATLGWFQYIFLPDVRFLQFLGWDDHLYRMVGTFLDPAFLALIFLLGIVIALYQKRTKLLYFLLFSLVFTYSRATYLALGIFLILKKKYFAILVFVIAVLMLPKMLSEGTDFTRTVSSYNKLENYKQTLEIIKKSPSLGIGFNNICLAKKSTDVNSHSCFGADNSILLILATTGVIGLIMLLYAISHMPYGIILKASFLLVLVHGLFTNSLFYPHIMFWLFSLVGLGSKVNRKRD